MTNHMYTMLVYATYALLAVIASALLFSVILFAVAVQEALRVVRTNVRRIIQPQKAMAEGRTIAFDAGSTALATGPCASSPSHATTVFGKNAETWESPGGVDC